MEFKPYINDLLHPRIKNFQDLRNHVDLVERLQKSFYFKTEDEIITNASLPLTLTEISVELFEKAIEELNSNKDVKQFSKFNLKYATRISRKACISPYCFILALIYIKRLKQTNPAYVKSQSACDLFLISLIVSSKFMYEENTDEEIFNCEWAMISGIDIKTLNKMEIEFLFKLNWKAYVSPLEFINEWIKIENLVIKNECKKRFFSITYNEIMRIFENDEIFQKLVSIFLTHISKFILISSFIYSSIILSLVLLTRSTVIGPNSLTILNQNLIGNQSIHCGYYYNVGQNKNADPNQDDVNDEKIKPNEQAKNIENLDEKLFDRDLNSKSLNLNKVSSLDLNELNNRLNIFKTRLDDANTRSNIYSIKQNSNQNCKFSNFSQFIKNFSLTLNSYNHNISDFKSKEELSFIQPFKKLFVDFQILI